MIRTLVTALVLASLTLATDARAAKRRPPPDIVEDAQAFGVSDRAKAIALLEGALQDGVDEIDLDIVEVHAGEHQRLAGNHDAAHDHFRSVLTRTRKGFEHEVARLGMALIDAQNALDAKTVDILEDVSEKEALPSQNADRFLALAVVEARAGNDAKMQSYARKAMDASADDPTHRAQIDARLAALAAAPREDGGIGSGTPASSEDPLTDADAAVAAGDLDRARKLAEVASASSDALVAERARGLLRALDGAAVDRNHIAVLLPLSGKYAAVGKQVQQALEFGFGSSARRLVVVDSGATPETAVQALEKAVLEQGAIAVVGPLLSDETDAVVAAAENLHVPLISLSQSYEDTETATYALQGMYTRTDQVRALLDYVVDQKALTRFAAFHPDNAFGTHAVEAFRAQAEAKGAKLLHVGAYAAEEENILPFAKKLGTRSGNLAQLRREAEEQGGNASTVVVPPIIDFDALFLPESAARTPLACAALAYEEFPMGDFRPKRDSPTIPLLGLSSWNTTALIASGNEYTRNSLFTDVFSDAAGTDPEFSVAYKASTGRTPTALEAATVDVGKLVAAAARSQADNRATFRSALLEAKVDDPVTGATHFDPEDLRAVRAMHILTITRTELQKVATVPLD